MIGHSKKNSQEKIVQENAFDEKKRERDRETGLKFNPGLALISPQTTGPRAVEVS